MAELVTMIFQRQRPGQRSVQWRKPPEMGDPSVIAQPVQADACRRPIIAKAQDRLRKVRSGHRIGYIGHQQVDFADGAEFGGLRDMDHKAIWGCDT